MPNAIGHFLFLTELLCVSQQKVDELWRPHSGTTVTLLICTVKMLKGTCHNDHTRMPADNTQSWQDVEQQVVSHCWGDAGGVATAGDSWVLQN